MRLDLLKSLTPTNHTLGSFLEEYQLNMLSFTQSLLKGFKYVPTEKERSFLFLDSDGMRIIPEGYFSFKFGESKEFEIAFEPLIEENQWYVALYKDGELMTEKVVIKPGK